MSESNRPNAKFRAVEQIVRGAAHCVRPSPDLRPRTIEAARSHCQDRRAEQKLGAFMLAVMILLLAGSPLMQLAHSIRARSKMPSTQDVEQRAIEYADRRDVGKNFGLIEAFDELRRLQADRLGKPAQQLR